MYRFTCTCCTRVRRLSDIPLFAFDAVCTNIVIRYSDAETYSLAFKAFVKSGGRHWVRWHFMNRPLLLCLESLVSCPCVFV